MKTELSLVQRNMMDDVNYRPYCGSVFQGHPNYLTCSSPRMIWSTGNSQMMCPECKWISQQPKEFIDMYKAKHNLK